MTIALIKELKMPANQPNKYFFSFILGIPLKAKYATGTAVETIERILKKAPTGSPLATITRPTATAEINVDIGPYNNAKINMGTSLRSNLRNAIGGNGYSKLAKVMTTDNAVKMDIADISFEVNIFHFTMVLVIILSSITI